MWRMYFETNHMFIMSHFALRYNELKHVVICNQQKVWKTTIYNTNVQLASFLQFLILKFDFYHLCKCKWIHEFIINLVTHVSSKEIFSAQHNLQNKRIDIKTLGSHYTWLKLTNNDIIITTGHSKLSNLTRKTLNPTNLNLNP